MKKLLALSLLLATTLFAFAETGFPSRSIRIVVGAAPGNGLDIVTRIFANEFELRTGIDVVVENNPGNNGSLAAVRVIRSQPDGYTLLAVSSSFVTSYSLVEKPLFNFSQLEPLGTIANTPIVLITSSKYKRVSELVEIGKKRELLFGAAAFGSVSHFAGVRFATDYGVKARPIYYRGTNDALTDIIGGRLDFYFAAAATTTGSEQLRAFQSVAYRNWSGLFAPAGIPSVAARRLEGMIYSTTTTALFSQRVKKVGANPLDIPPEKFEAFLQKELKTFRAMKVALKDAAALQ